MARLKEIRVLKRLRQKDLQKKTKILVPRLSKIENGLVTARPDERKKIERALGGWPLQWPKQHKRRRRLSLNFKL